MIKISYQRSHSYSKKVGLVCTLDYLRKNAPNIHKMSISTKFRFFWERLDILVLNVYLAHHISLLALSLSVQGYIKII